MSTETRESTQTDLTGKWTDGQARAYLETTRTKLTDALFSRMLNDKRQSSFENDHNVCGE